MKIEAATVITLAYEIRRADGVVIESSEKNGPVTFVHGQSGMLPGLDARLEGMECGQEATFEFTPEQAFGRVEDAPQKTISRAEFPKDVEMKAGARFDAAMPGGQHIILEVVDVKEESVLVRMIHPLAGQKITIKVAVKDVRPATPEEFETGKPAPQPPPLPRQA